MSKLSGYYEKIDMFLQGELPEDEARTFNDEIKRDTALAQEVSFYKEVEQAISEKDISALRSNLTQIMMKKETPLQQEHLVEASAFNFGLSEEMKSFREFFKPLGANELNAPIHSLPRMHLFQYQMAAKENIHQFYKEQFSEVEGEEELLLPEEELLFEEIEVAMAEKDITELRSNLQQIVQSIPEHQRSTEEIERYFDQSMDADELAGFESELEINKWLQKDVNLHMEVDHSIGESDIMSLRAQLQEIQEAEFSSSQRIEDIDRYLTNDFDPVELASFEDELLENMELTEDLNLYKEIDTALLESDILQLRNRLQDIGKETISTGKQRAVRWMPSKVALSATAASLVILLGLGAIISRQTTSDYDIYNKFYQVQQIPDVSRSASFGPDKLISDGLLRFNDKEYDAAIALFREVSKTDQNNAVSHFYSAVSYQETGRYTDAIREYQSVIEENDNLFVEQARWNMALVYLKKGEHDTAYRQIEQIANENGFYAEKAKVVIRKMKKQS